MPTDEADDINFKLGKIEAGYGILGTYGKKPDIFLGEIDLGFAYKKNNSVVGNNLAAKIIGKTKYTVLPTKPDAYIISNALFCLYKKYGLAAIGETSGPISKMATNSSVRLIPYTETKPSPGEHPFIHGLKIGSFCIAIETLKHGVPRFEKLDQTY